MGYLFVLLSALFAAAGQVFLKMGADGNQNLMDFANYKIVAGLFFYIVGALLWIVSLSKLPLKIVYPFTALTFVLVYACAFFLFNESIGKIDFLGVFFVLLGLFLLVYNGL